MQVDVSANNRLIAYALMAFATPANDYSLLLAGDRCFKRDGFIVDSNHNPLFYAFQIAIAYDNTWIISTKQGDFTLELSRHLTTKGLAKQLSKQGFVIVHKRYRKHLADYFAIQVQVFLNTH